MRDGGIGGEQGVGLGDQGGGVGWSELGLAMVVLLFGCEVVVPLGRAPCTWPQTRVPSSGFRFPIVSTMVTTPCTRCRVILYLVFWSSGPTIQMMKDTKYWFSSMVI